MNIQEAIKAVIARNNLTIEESVDVFTEIMSGTATDAQIAALIVALRFKGETAEEITGAASVMRQKATQILPQKNDFVIDTCGTGGDGANTFNISTVTAFVAAGAGAVVAKHGNRSVSSKCGSADVLEKLGVRLTISPESMTKCLEEVGVSFLFAPYLHKAMKYAINPRKEIGIRTIFNVLGPLTNPALAPSQLLGVFSPDLTETLAVVLKNMGSRKAYVVHGLDSLDEISISAATQVSELNNREIRTYTIEPELFGLNKAPHESIVGGDAEFNAKIITGVLNGKTGPARDIVLLNSAFAIAASGVAQTPQDGFRMAKESLDSGKALKKLNELVAFSTSH